MLGSDPRLRQGVSGTTVDVEYSTSAQLGQETLSPGDPWNEPSERPQAAPRQAATGSVAEFRAARILGPLHRVQFSWREWQRKAGFDRIYSFHALRHTAVTNVYRASSDLFLAQRFARGIAH